MNFQPVNIIQVQYCKGNSIVPMGRLAIKNRKIFFEYTTDFLELGFELSPFKLPLKPGIIACKDPIFDGLFGVFNDSLPDGWGRLLLDRKLIKMGLNPHSMTPLDRLRYVGTNGMGALQYQPEFSMQSTPTKMEALDRIAEECNHFLEYNDDQSLDELLIMNGSSAGARPKILVSLVAKKNELSITENTSHSLHNDWIIKFRSQYDPKDMGSIEFAYHLMAKEAGLNVPKAKLFESKKCSGYFGVKRFDREKSKFLHMHTISGLLHADHRVPSLDYETLLKATLRLTKDVRECEKQFRHAIFNIIAHNRDDHSKNFSFLMDENGIWSVSPAYDLTFSFGPGGEHCTTIMGEGKNPNRENIMNLAQIAGITQQKTVDIIEQVKEAVSKWNYFAKESNVSHDSTNLIQVTINRIMENL